MIVTRTEHGFTIAFAYRPHLVEAVKQIPGKRWDYINKSWFAPAKGEKEVLEFAKKYNFQVSGMQAEEIIKESDAMPELTVDIPLRMQLFPYQKEGVAYGLLKKRLIIGDVPGLGKTAQAIAMVTGANAFPCLVICPSTLKINWQREWHMWTSYKAMMLTDAVKRNFPLYYSSGMAQVFIVNYESLKKYFVESISTPKGAKLRLDHVHFKKQLLEMFRSVIIDESHRVKSTATQQTKFTKGICSGKEFILALTGTPVINKPKDLVSQLSIIEQLSAFGGYQKFVQRYCAGPNEASNLRELNYYLNQYCFYRRDKKDVLKDLPDKTRTIALCDITTRREYSDAERDLIDYLRRYKEADDEKIARSMRGEIMVRIGILKNVSARGKLQDVFEFVDDLMESGEKLVLFAHLHEVIHAVKDHYPDAVSVTGEDDHQSRQKAVDRFQNDESVKLIVCSIKAAGVGLTLTASSRVAFIELPWTAADCDQAEDRCHRIGQRDNVTCTYFLGKDTIDEKIYEIIRSKREVAATITGSTEQVEEDVINLIVDLFNQKP